MKISTQGCEAINDALGLEINHSISEIRTFKLLSLRLDQMSSKERAAIPPMAWSAMESAYPGKFKHLNPAVPTEGNENSAEWFTVVSVTSSKFEIRLEKIGRIKWINSLRQKPKYREWSKLHNPIITYSSADQDVLWIDCKAFDGAPADFVKTVLSGMR